MFREPWNRFVQLFGTGAAAAVVTRPPALEPDEWTTFGRNVHRLLSRDGNAIVFVPDMQFMPCQNALSAAGLYRRNWIKIKLPSQHAKVRRLSTVCLHGLHVSKSARHYFWDQTAASSGGVPLDDMPLMPPNPDHDLDPGFLSTFVAAVAAPDRLVLDPFASTCYVGLAAVSAGRNFAGASDYPDLAAGRRALTDLSPEPNR